MTNKKTVAESVWDEIKDVELDLYGLAGQKVSILFETLPVEPKALYLRLKKPGASATLAALEDALIPGDPKNHKYLITSASNGMLTITKKLDVASIVNKLDQA